MADDIENDVLNTYLNNERNSLLSMIGSLMLIELGTISEISREGRATVQLMRMVEGKIIELEDIELLFAGNSRGAAFRDSTGSICLLLCPRTLVEDTRTQAVQEGIVTIHNAAGVKAIPLSNNYQCPVVLDYTEDGGITIGTDKASILVSPGGEINIGYNDFGTIINEQGISAYTSKGPSSFIYNPDGSIMECLWANTRPLYLRIREVNGTERIYRNGLEDATGEQRDDITTYDKWQWVEEYNADGTRTTTLYDSDGNIVRSITQQPDGTEDTNSTSPFTVIVTDPDGNEQVSIRASNDGNLNIDTKGDVSITTEGAVSIEATKQGLLTLKNSVDSLGKIIESIIDNMNTFSQNVQSIDTVGSPASHSAGPGIIANMTNLQTQLAQLKQKAGQVLG